MSLQTPSLILVACLALYHGAQAAEKPAFIDLTMDLVTNETLFFPAWPYSYERLTIMNFTNDFFGVEAYGFKMAIHVGTHIDAPCHVRPLEGTYQRLHEVPLERFLGPGCVMDIKAKVDADEGYVMTKDDLDDWEKENGKVPKGAVVLVHTGWAKKKGATQENYWGGEDLTNETTWIHPSIHPELAEYLVQERDINAIGLDLGTPDIASSNGGAHLAILGNNRIIIENVASTLENVPATGYRIHIMPIKLYDTCGAPIRLMAFKEPDPAEMPNGAAGIHAGVLSGLVAVLALRSML